MFPRMTTVGIEVLTICTRAHGKISRSEPAGAAAGAFAHRRRYRSTRTQSEEKRRSSSSCANMPPQWRPRSALISDSFWDSHLFERTPVPAFRCLPSRPCRLPHPLRSIHFICARIERRAGLSRDTVGKYGPRGSRTHHRPVFLRTSGEEKR